MIDKFSTSESSGRLADSCAAIRAGMWIVIPAYAEESVVGGVVTLLRETYPRIVVVDDGSPDLTGQLARTAGATVLRHAVNLGQGAALQTGIDYARARGATSVCTFDADGQHPIEGIDAMIRALALGNVDIVLGSRFRTDSPVPPLKRALLSAALLFTRLHARLAITDTHNGLRLFGPRALAAISITQPGMAHASEILHAIGTHKLRWVEVPTRIEYTDYSLAKGQSIFNAVKILLDLLFSALSRRT